MDFKDTLDYLYNLLPMYQRIGKSAFKKDLTNTLRLCELLNNPQNSFKSIHIAGTNGKGSSAHMIASILQTAGYKTGLYTSPHLKSFTERIKVNGREMEEDFVVGFIEDLKNEMEEIQPSFFELTVAMAFQYFAKQKVDIAVIEVGLGGRFDSTNVITPIISLITSIGLDHTDMLGETLPEIAFEKAGIIKEGIPVVISETQGEVIEVFKDKANEADAPIFFADHEFQTSIINIDSGVLHFQISNEEGTIIGKTDLAGEYQVKNIPGVMKVIDLLNQQGLPIGKEHLAQGFSKVVENTGILGRWQTLYDNPLTICDTAHNQAGVNYLISQIEKMDFEKLFVIWGAVEGKDLNRIFKNLPQDAFYYFCEASVPRAMSSEKLKSIAVHSGLNGIAIKDVNEAISKARGRAKEDDLIIIGGSNFIIAEIKNLKS